MQAGDRALYLAKHLGRNRVQLGVDPAEQPGRGLPSTSVFSFLEDLSEEVDARQGTPDHSIAMARWCVRLAGALGLDHERRERCVLAARFHDVGKIAVPDSILSKPGPLTEDEWRLVREHPTRGADIIALVTELADVAPVVRDHHERWDGNGYPAGKCGEEIALEARIVAVCDAWSAMNAHRAYRPPLEPATALDELRTGSGTQFDPRVVEAFLTLEPAPDGASPSPPTHSLTKAPFPARRGRGRR